MEFLKRLFFGCTLMIFCVAAHTQDMAKVQEAFKLSYQFEADTVNSDQAITMLENVYSEASYEINLRLGWLYYQAGQYNRSIQYYTKAVNLMPYSEEAKLGLIYPKSALAQWDDMLDLYKQILVNNPGNTYVNYQVGLIYYNKKQYDKAYTHFKRIVDLYPFSYDGLLMYAWTNLQLGKSREAKVLFSKVLMLSPDDASALDGLKALNGGN